MKAEVIQIEILSTGVAFMNGDGLKRLLEVGAVKPKLAEQPKIGVYQHSQVQSHALAKITGIQSLERYRELVGDPNTKGLLHYFLRGNVLTMERNRDPRNPEIPVYCVLDTSIFATASFITKLAQTRRIRVLKRDKSLN